MYGQNFDVKIRRDDGKNNSYECRVYESVDEKNAILGYISKFYPEMESGNHDLLKIVVV